MARAALLAAALLMTAAAHAQTPPLPSTVAEGATVEVAHTGEGFYEGPVWVPEIDSLLFTVCRAEKILRLDAAGEVTVWMENTGGTNGMTLGNDGRLLGAVVMAHQITSVGVGRDGPVDVTILASDENWAQPNDVCQSPQGHIYFTDPNWSDPPQSAVYHLAPSGAITRIEADVEIPNGVITSLDGSTLFLGDSRRARWLAFPINDDGSVGEGSIFFDPDFEDRSDPDGMAVDEQGNLYFSGRGGVWVVTPEGEALGLIPTPAFCSNAGFGGEDGRTLFMTGRDVLWSLRMGVRGAGL